MGCGDAAGIGSLFRKVCAMAGIIWNALMRQTYGFVIGEFMLRLLGEADIPKKGQGFQIQEKCTFAAGFSIFSVCRWFCDKRRGWKPF